MGQTILTMDVVRRELSETRFTVTRNSRDIVAGADKNCLYQWPSTGSCTLQPINQTTDFTETSHWEALKYRLTDMTYNPAWFTEVPNNTLKGVGPCDYFQHGVVKNVNYTLGENVFKNLIGTVTQTAINAINFENPNGVISVVSKASQTANQGYVLRFHLDGRAGDTRAGVMDFYFGDFFLRLNSEGVAQLWQSTDFVNYGYVYSFVYAFYGQVHGRSHKIVIFPHARNKIEFIASTKDLEISNFYGMSNTVTSVGIGANQCYTIPGAITYQADGVTPLITQAGAWAIGFSREFRPAFQVSKLGFANGTNPEAFLWDAPIDITSRTGVVSMPLVTLIPSVECDQNGGSVQWALRNPDTGGFFMSDGMSGRVQFAIGMQGIGDIPGPGLGSSITPEVYNYTIDKPPLFISVPRTPYEALVEHVTVDHGDSPEAERLSVTSYDSGAYLRFSERGDIPVELGDPDSDLVYFEGTAYEVEAGEAPAQTPIGLKIEAHGMIDNLLRMEWTDTAPNFEIDPQDSEHRPYLIAEAIRVCFEAAGVPREEVVIEEEELWLKDFRLWPGPDSTDGTAGATPSTKGEGHGAGALHQKRWYPQPNLPVHEFTDHLIRKILGWHWTRDRSDRKWHIYKRPDPQVASDSDKMNPIVEFYSDSSAQRAGHPAVGWNGKDLPAYKHSDLKKSTKRPNCTTIVVEFMISTTGIPDRTALDAILKTAATGASNAGDPILTTTEKVISMPFTNYNGYANPRNPNPDVSHPDFLGRQRIHVLSKPEISGRESAAWIGRRLFEDNCFGYLYRTFEADWGDEFTYNLRKWDMVLVNGEQHYIHRIEPKWGPGKPRRAHYKVSKFRPDVRPPR